MQKRDVNHVGQTSDLLCRMLEDYNHGRGICSITGSIYCTAWVSMVAKPESGGFVWLSPSSFQYICDHQQNNGGWEGKDMIDEILNTLACLLSLKHHEKTDGEHSNLTDRIAMAITFLTDRFAEWDITNTDRVAFEILVPALLKQLERHRISFQFASREKLFRLKETKLSKFSLAHLYKYPTPLLFSLEAFVDMIDFNKIRQHLFQGSMMCSPSSTAAYLMNVSEWDERAEQYLRDAVDNGRRNGEGLVAMVYPMSTFELAWVHSSFSFC